ncbi:MAG: RNA pseudouridine synthase [Planctomycetota bacterium]|nr:RNA pseudouridine synthase [Planctomycetota bacterium]
MHHCEGGLSTINGVLRPGIVHRLDRFTSGLLVCAKSDASLKSLLEQFKERTVRKRYVALAHGNVPKCVKTIDEPLGRHRSDFRRITVRPDVGRRAVTEIKAVKWHGKYSVVHVGLLTGRTHQIRVHLRHIGHPILCDHLYRERSSRPRTGYRTLCFALRVSRIRPSGKRPAHRIQGTIATGHAKGAAKHGR